MGCPSDICGVWRQRLDRCQSLCPFLEGLGLPPAITWAACPIVDNVPVTLRISCPEAGRLEVVDKTKLFGRNVTSVPTDGTEIECASKAKKKPFMLSAQTTSQSAVLTCRLISRGPNWYTRQERLLSSEKDASGQPMLIERHVLVRPDREDVVVERLFARSSVSDEDLRL